MVLRLWWQGTFSEKHHSHYQNYHHTNQNTCPHESQYLPPTQVLYANHISNSIAILHLTLPHLSTHVAENPTDPAENKVLKNWSQNSGTKKMYCYLCQSWGNRMFLCMWNRICIFLGITFNFYFNLCVFNNKRAVLQNAKWLYRQFFFYRKSFQVSLYLYSICIYMHL